MIKEYNLLLKKLIDVIESSILVVPDSHLNSKELNLKVVDAIWQTYPRLNYYLPDNINGHLLHF